MSKSALIGYTGFVGSNIDNQFEFTDKYNSSNIEDIRGKNYDFLVCSAIPSAMWLANSDPKKDLNNIWALIDILSTVKVKRIVLISTIAVYAQPVIGPNEDDIPPEKNLAYGRNRMIAENEIRKIFPELVILRLPALFGKNLKKNFIYDLKNLEPAFLKKEKYEEIINYSNRAKKYISNYYSFNDDKGMYVYNKEKAARDSNREEIVDCFKKMGFTSLKFTNPNSCYQFYFLDNLMKDIQMCYRHNIQTLNICSEPIKASKIARDFFGIDMGAESECFLYNYDLRSKYSRLWGHDSSYLYSKDEVYDGLTVHFRREA